MSVTVVAASGRRGACQTLDATDRRRQPAHGNERQHGREPVGVDMANPSGHVEVLLEVQAASVVGSSLRALLPDPWRSLERRGDGLDLS